MKALSLILLFCSLVLTIGCSEMKFADLPTEVKQIDKQIDDDDPIVVKQPVCQADPADYILKTKALSFEVADKYQLSFGFNLLKGFFKAIGIDINIKSGQLDMAMELATALTPTKPIAASLGKGKFNETDIGASIDLVKFGIDAGYYHRTPFSKMSERALTNTIENLLSELDKNGQTPWSTKVMRVLNQNTEVIIPVGMTAGLKKQDQFAIYNIEYHWQGIPCQSDFWVARRTTSQPIAIFEVEELEQRAAGLKLVSRAYNEFIEEGAIVEVHKLVQDPAAKKKDQRSTLKRSIRIGETTSGPLMIGDKELDLTPYMKEQLKTVIKKYNYYPY